MDVFHFDRYKEFINEKINSLPKKGRGVKGQLAEKLRCQTSYISQVLGGSADLNLEQSLDLCEFFHMHGDEKEYFLTLVQFERAGTKTLKDHFQSKLNELKEKRLTLHRRLKKQTALSFEDSAQYFSSWMYAAIHVLITIKKYQSIKEVSSYLNIDEKTVGEVLNFLEEKGLAKNENGKFSPGTTSLYLDKTSPFIRQHHTNWRNQAMQSMNRHLDQNLHYSSVISVSHKDAQLIKDEMINFIAKIKGIVKDSSPEETLKGLCLDLFELD